MKLNHLKKINVYERKFKCINYGSMDAAALRAGGACGRLKDYGAALRGAASAQGRESAPAQTLRRLPNDRFHGPKIDGFFRTSRLAQQFFYNIF